MERRKSTHVRMEDLLPVMEEQLKAGGAVTFNPRGTSMLPLIHEGRDSVTLVCPPDRLKKYDLPLYRRESGQFVLHRVVAVKNSGYTMCGDNQWDWEPGIPHSAVIGVVKEIIRDGKRISVNGISYRVYCRFWVVRQWGKGILLRGKSKIKRMLLGKK